MAVAAQTAARFALALPAYDSRRRVTMRASLLSASGTWHGNEYMGIARGTIFVALVDPVRMDYGASALVAVPLVFVI